MNKQNEKVFSRCENCVFKDASRNVNYNGRGCGNCGFKDTIGNVNHNGWEPIIK